MHSPTAEEAVSFMETVRTSKPRNALHGGSSKVNFQETLLISGDKCPQNGSKNDPMAPRTTLECPHEGPSVVSLEWAAVRNERATALGAVMSQFDPFKGFI